MRDNIISYMQAQESRLHRQRGRRHRLAVLFFDIEALRTQAMLATHLGARPGACQSLGRTKREASGMPAPWDAFRAQVSHSDSWTSSQGHLWASAPFVTSWRTPFHSVRGRHGNTHRCAWRKGGTMAAQSSSTRIVWQGTCLAKGGGFEGPSHFDTRPDHRAPKAKQHSCQMLF